MSAMARQLFVCVYVRGRGSSLVVSESEVRVAAAGPGVISATRGASGLTLDVRW